MTRSLSMAWIVLVLTAVVACRAFASDPVRLPDPVLKGTQSLEEVLARRKSTREYSGQALSLAHVSQLLWAAQGITRPDGRRTAPSAGALYPLHVYLVANRVEGLPVAIYRYSPAGGTLARVVAGDTSPAMTKAAFDQASVGTAAAVILITGNRDRIEKKYGAGQAQRYVDIEVGLAAENVCLQATALGLGVLTIGGYVDDEVAKVARLSPGETPLLLMPVGHPAR